MARVRSASGIRLDGFLRAAPPVIVLILAVVLFAAPLAGAATFGFTLPTEGPTLLSLAEVVRDRSFLRAILLTLQLAVLTCALGLVIVVPTLVILHLRLPRLLPVAEALSVLPYVVPAIALVNGANVAFRATFPGFLASPYSLVPFYVIIALPFLHRAVDSGLRSADLSTQWSASRSLGAGNVQSLLLVVVPALRTSLISGILLTVAIVLGEFAMASLLMHFTYPVFMTQAGRNHPHGAAALAVITILSTWLLLAAITSAGRRQKRVARPEMRDAVSVMQPLPVPGAEGLPGVSSRSEISR